MDEFYIIILDSDINNSTHWEYVAERATQEEIKEVKQYSIKDRQSRSKEDYEGEFIGDKKVVCIETGTSANGKIYKLTKKGEKQK